MFNGRVTPFEGIPSHVWEWVEAELWLFIQVRFALLKISLIKRILAVVTDFFITIITTFLRRRLSNLPLCSFHAVLTLLIKREWTAFYNIVNVVSRVFFLVGFYLNWIFFVLDLTANFCLFLSLMLQWHDGELCLYQGILMALLTTLLFLLLLLLLRKWRIANRGWVWLWLWWWTVTSQGHDSNFILAAERFK